MAKPSRREIARALVRKYPQSHAEVLGIQVQRNTPAPLYQWLIASLLFSARISASAAQRAAEALLGQGWRTPAKLAATAWRQRVTVLNRAGYARYDESTSRYIGETTALLIERYGGDLRNLREVAGRDPVRERELIKEFKGVGDVGADIFFREVQLAWDELYPFADRRALAAAEKLGLGSDARSLARLVDGKTSLPVLLSALVRADLAGELNEILEESA